MNDRRLLQRGYSLTELLTVVAMIGVLSLFSVPAFMNFYRATKMRTAMRTFGTDVRAARQRAVTQHRRVAVTVATGLTPTGHPRGSYSVWERNEDGDWTLILERYLPPERTDPIFFESTTFTNFVDDGTNVGGDDRPDIIFLPNGAIANHPGGNATLVLRTDYKIAKPTITMTFSTAGNFRSVEQ
ncbi:MAG TPA: GspH/FimT family pseudopilin [Thermoanaerobaculia bacterium]|jgi:prepilin-type N-terminal cleavage/methylation domain-containing protein|nr:GspH/FimT family pseudopilin [Thermoanaerobaculia bacterium]